MGVDSQQDTRHGTLAFHLDFCAVDAHLCEDLVERTYWRKEDNGVYCVPTPISMGDPHNAPEVALARTVVEIGSPRVALMPRTADVVNLPVCALELSGCQAERVFYDACRLQSCFQDIICRGKKTVVRTV